MPRRIALTFLMTMLCCHVPAKGAEVDLNQITALATAYFRDSAEIPMSVAVTTVVTDGAGKVKHQGQSTVGMVFNGYNQGSGKFSLRANSGMFNAGALRDSLSGDLAAFFAGGLISKKNSTHTIAIQQPSEPGKPVLVVVKDGECPELQLMERWMFPRNPCGASQFSVHADSQGGLMFQHFSFESSGRPAPAKITGLGDVQLTAFHADVEFQAVQMPGDSKPFLWPLEAVTSVTTNKGKVTITNRYSPKKP
jgi:hypothetical protein